MKSLNKWLSRIAGAQIIVDVELEVRFEFVGEIAFVGVFVKRAGDA
jgi:hypothetical protein